MAMSGVQDPVLQQPLKPFITIVLLGVPSAYPSLVFSSAEAALAKAKDATANSVGA
jgi:hypothetical protein